MGITYQTSNRQRRKVMTAPLTPLPETETPEITVSGAAQPSAIASAPRRVRVWPVALGAVAGAIALFAARLF